MILVILNEIQGNTPQKNTPPKKQMFHKTVVILNKTHMKNNHFLLMLALSASLFSCKKDDPAPETASVNVIHASPDAPGVDLLVDNSKDFENFILSHENIKFNKVTGLLNHENENELFLIGKKLTYKMLLHIINTNIKAFNNNVEYLRVENETLRQIIASSNQTQEEYNHNTIIQELLKNQKELFVLKQRMDLLLVLIQQKI